MVRLQTAQTSPAQVPDRVAAHDPARVPDDVAAGDVDAAVRFAVTLGPRMPLPASGRTLERWTLLASVAAGDLTAARVLEAHADALAILAESSDDGTTGKGARGNGAVAPPGSSWGVFAAEQPGSRLAAGGDDVTGWTLTGRKPWCSLAGRLSHALVTAHVGREERRLFAVPLGHPGVSVVPDTWHARGLAAVTSGPVDLVDVPATPVGGTGWYLRRPGFAHGGVGVAACWFGGAVAVARALHAAARRRPPDQLAAWHLGEVDVDLAVARAALHDAAAAVDAGRARGEDGEELALRTRAVVAGSAERVLARAGHALGPAPLTLDEEHARRVADLTVYLRQHHAERDLARLGERVAASPVAPW